MYDNFFFLHFSFFFFLLRILSLEGPLVSFPAYFLFVLQWVLFRGRPMDIILLLQDCHLQRKERPFLYIPWHFRIFKTISMFGPSQTFLMGFPDSSVGKESTCKAGDHGWIPGLGRSTGEEIGYPLQYSWASLVVQLVKNPLQCKRPGFDPWVGKIPLRRERLPTPVFWPGEFHGLYSPWVTKSWTWLSDFHFTNLPQQQP